MHPEPTTEADFASNREMRPSAELPPANDIEPGRALVVTVPSPEPTAMPSCIFRPDASFVAHLIAAAANAPQTRMLRRASPAQAKASYQGALERRQHGLLQQNGSKTSLVA